MPETTPQIIGLEKRIVSKDFGVELSFHVLRMYSVNLYDGSCSATFAGFASRAAFDAGLQPLIHTTAQIKAAPSGDVAQLPHWFALQLLAPDSTHDLSGAMPVYAAAPDEEPAA